LFPASLRCGEQKLLFDKIQVASGVFPFQSFCARSPSHAPTSDNKKNDHGWDNEYFDNTLESAPNIRWQNKEKEICEQKDHQSDSCNCGFPNGDAL
jgi:hypothetical protein